jgi:hypothetical protein
MKIQPIYKCRWDNGYKNFTNQPPDKDNKELIADIKKISDADETERWNFVLKHYYIISKCIFGKMYRRHDDDIFSEGTRALFDATKNWEYCELESEDVNVRRFYALSHKYIMGYIYKYMFFLRTQLTYPAFDDRKDTPLEVSIQKMIETSGDTFETELHSFEELGDNFNAMFIADVFKDVINSKDEEVALTDVQKKYVEALQEVNFNKSEAARLLQKRHINSCGGFVASKICKFIALNPDKESFFLSICNDQAKAHYKKIKTAFLMKHAKNEAKKIKTTKVKRIFSDEHREKIVAVAKRNSQKNIKVYQVLDPQGNTYETTEGLEKFCNDHGLCARNLLSVLKGRSKQHKGWQAVNSVLKSRKTITVYKIVSPDGIVFETTNGLSDFCKSKGLTYDMMLRVVRGKRPHHKGWKVCEGYEIIPQLDLHI